jgi:class 3 adenylate cyclase/tetratricopeptide (TPR) repeat protein
MKGTGASLLVGSSPMAASLIDTDSVHLPLARPNPVPDDQPFRHDGPEILLPCPGNGNFKWVRVGRVREWLTSIGFPRYGDAFEENGVDFDLLIELTNEDLKDLGVDRLADRKAILGHIAVLKPEEAPAGPSPPELAARPPLDGERRQVTVVFADIVDYTKLSSELGPESTHALLNRYFDSVDGIVEAYGGSIDKHMGDNVMAVFGAPIAHDDDPLRALRTALEIHEGMAHLSVEVGHPIRAHIGVASGQVVASGTGSHAHSEYTVTGNSVNLASRLQDRALPGETLISENVRRAVMDQVDCVSAGEMMVKGIERPIHAWRVAGLRGDELGGAKISFIGRRAEIAQFAGIMEACRTSGKGQTVVVRGDAGIGKTRLVEEFSRLAASQGFQIHRSLVLDFGVGKGRDAVRSVVRGLLNIPQGSSKGTRQAAADTAFAKDVIGTDLRPFLHDLLDLTQRIDERAMYEALDHDRRNEGKRRAVSELVRAVSARAPVFIVIEDIHWANRLTVPYLATLATVAADCSVLLVMTSRHEGDPLDPAWRAMTDGAPLMTIDLGPFRHEEARRLAAAIADTDTRFVQDCITRSGGNPLFLEQLLRNAEAQEDEDIPASIQSLVLARMDRLAPANKRALQVASVIGQRFALSEIRFLLGDDTFELSGLLGEQLVRPEGDSFLFSHAMIRDGVYASLLTTTRERLHVRAAEWFAEKDFTLKAQHLEQGNDPGAPIAYLEAAKAQAGRYRYDIALMLVRRGRPLAKTASDQFALTALHGEILNSMGVVTESLNTYLDALDFAADDVDRCRAWLGIAAGLRLSNDTTGALSLLERAEPVAKRLGLTLELAQLYHLRGNLHFVLGNVEACGEAHAEGLDHARRAGSPEAEAKSLGGVGDAAYARGRMATAFRNFSDCVTLCQHQGLGRVEVAHRAMAGWSAHYLNTLQQALDLTMGAAEAARDVGEHRAELNAVVCSLFVMYELADLSDAPPLLTRLPVLIKQLGARAWEPMIGWLGAHTLEAEGRHEEALVSLEAAVSLARQVSVGFLAPRILGYFAMLTDDPETRASALRDGEEMLAKGSLGHNFLGFHRWAIDACLRAEDWAGMEHHARALEIYTNAEPLPSSTYFISRGRALAAYGLAKNDSSALRELVRVRDEAERIGLHAALPVLEDALAAT